MVTFPVERSVFKIFYKKLCATIYMFTIVTMMVPEAKIGVDILNYVLL